MKKRKFLCLLSTVLCFFASGSISAQKASLIGGYDIGRTSNVMGNIRTAAQNNMSMVTFSHDIIMDRNVIEANPDKFESYASLAAEYDMESYFWNHAFYDIPADYIINKALDFDNPGLWTWLRGVYRNIFTQVPSMTGVVISFTEGDSYQIHRSEFEPEQSQIKIITELAPAQRLEKYIMELYEELSSMNKKLIIRDFWRSNTEAGFLREALYNCPTDIMVYTKHTANDFRYGYPLNESLGAYPERMQFLEIEPSQPDPFYYQKQYQLAYEKGVQGIIPRYREDGGIFRSLNNQCFNALINDLYQDITPIISELRYTDNDIEAMKNYMKTYVKANYVWEFYIGKHMQVEESKYAGRLYKGEGREMYTSDDETNTTTRRIRGLTQESYGDEAKKEKDEAREEALHWSELADNASLKKDFKAIADYAALYGPSVKKFIDDNYARVQSGKDKCPLPPDNVTLTINPDDPRSVIVTWNDNANNEMNYKVERMDNNGMMYQRAILDKNTTSYVDKDLVPGSTYTYRVRAYGNTKNYWNSPYSYNVSITLEGGSSIEDISKNPENRLIVSPTPFQEEINLSIKLQSPSLTKVSVYNATGTKLQELFNSYLQAGEHTIGVNGNHLLPGVYWFTMQTEEGITTTKSIKVK